MPCSFCKIKSAVSFMCMSMSSCRSASRFNESREIPPQTCTLLVECHYLCHSREKVLYKLVPGDRMDCSACHQTLRSALHTSVECSRDQTTSIQSIEDTEKVLKSESVGAGHMVPYSCRVPDPCKYGRRLFHKGRSAKTDHVQHKGCCKIRRL